MEPRIKRTILIAMGCVLAAAFSIVVLLAYRKMTDPVTRGIRLNREAWELSFTERGFPVPPSGPREGYWGSRVGRAVPHPGLGWYQRELSIPGLIEIDKRGFQYYKSASRNKSNVLILGGSVAFGAYASEIVKTYFHLIGEELERGSTPSDITIIAAGAWKSIQEIAALKLYGPLLRPDIVIFLDGLNDLTNGATSRTLYGQPVETLDSSKWTPLYHAHDYHQRVADYLENMRQAAELTAQLRSDLLVVLQPSLVERTPRTQIENVLLEGSLKPHASAAALMESYETMRRSLGERARSRSVHFLALRGFVWVICSRFPA